MFNRKLDVSSISSILVLVLINYGLVSLVYYGHKRENIAAKGESAILGLALRYTSYDLVDSKNRVLVVNATLEDTLSLASTQQGKLLDLDAAVYSQMIEKAHRFGAKNIILGWLSGAHQLHMEKSNAVFDVVERLGIHEKFSMSASLFYLFQVPEDIKRKFNIVLAIDCVYDLNLYCSIPTWNDWIYTNLYNKYATQHYQTKNLPHQYENVILNYPHPSQIPVVSAKTFLKGEFTTNADVIIFGNEIPQPKLFEDNKIDIQRTKYAKTDGFWRSSVIQKDGIPLSNFFAGFVTMLLEEKGVFVANQTQENTVAFLCLLLIVVLYLTLGLGSSILCALALLISLVPLSYMEIQYLSLYIPKFFLALVIFLSVISIVYFHLFRTRTQRLVTETEQQVSKKTLDVRKNFLSLISHNLKTPIAQIQAGVEYLKATDSQKENTLEYGKVLDSIQGMNRNVRTMLKTATLQETNRHNKISLRQLFSSTQNNLEFLFENDPIISTRTPIQEWQEYIMALVTIHFKPENLTVRLRPSNPNSISIGIIGPEKEACSGFEEKVLRQYVTTFQEQSGMTHRVIRQDHDLTTLVVEPKVIL